VSAVLGEVGLMSSGGIRLRHAAFDAVYVHEQWHLLFPPVSASDAVRHALDEDIEQRGCLTRCLTALAGRARTQEPQAD
jgi:hypothetical protein